MGPEGGLCVRVRVAAGRVAGCSIESTRPDVATRLLTGRSAAEIAQAVPRLFSVCAASQAVACGLALAAAGAPATDPALAARGPAAVADETLRESARRVLLDWPRLHGEQPAPDAVAAARATLGPAPAAARVAQAVFGAPAGEWLARRTPVALQVWADAGTTAAARCVARLAAHPAEGDCAVPLLDARPSPAWLAELAATLQADPGFAHRPLWQGAAAETGALARRQADPLVAALLQRSRVLARGVARLRELALLLQGQPALAVGSQTLPDGSGLGWVDSARGLLLHLVRLQQGRAVLYRILAPTEWNFHPAGALAAALQGSVAGDAAALQNRVRRLVDSLDPCVACRVEVEHA